MARPVLLIGALPVCLLMMTLQASAMQALDDSDLAGVAGQDGISVQLDGNMSADAIRATLDTDTAREATISTNGLTFQGVSPTGVIDGNAGMEFTLDAGSNGTDPLLRLGFGTTERTRLRIDNLTAFVYTDDDSDPETPDVPVGSDRSYGTWAFDFEGNVDLINKGIFNMAYKKAYLLGQITDADLFYSQDDNAWMAMHDFNLSWEIPEGTLGINNEGIVHRAGELWSEGDPQRQATEWQDANSNGTVDEGELSGYLPSASDLINLALDFEYIFGKQGSNEFEITAGARGLMHFGWLGSVKDAEVKWMPGGVWQGSTDGVFDPYGTEAVTSNGLRFSSQWDYVSQVEAEHVFGDAEKEFRWRLGETADVASADKSRVNFELGDWTIWGSRTAAKPSAHYFPLIALDVISGAGQGPGGLCWGHGSALVDGSGGASGCGSTAEPDTQFIDVTPGSITNYGITENDENALAIIIRDGQLQSYSRKVRLLERDASGNIRTDTDPNRPEEEGREFDWGLIYSLANVNGNIYLYPGITRDGTAGAVTDNQGVIADILLMSQTLDGDYQGHNWDHGTHLMIADTAANMGIGFMSSSFVLAANDTRIWVKPQDGTDYYSGGLDFFSPQARFNYRATFGGGLLPGHANYGNTSVAQTIRGANLDVNLEGLVSLRFSPSDPVEANNPGGARNFLGYSGALRLGSNTTDPSMVGGTSNLATCGSGGNEDCGSYLSIAEPSQPEAAIKLANITGDIAFTEGRVDLVGTGELGTDSEPQMVIANNIKLGYAAKPHMNSVLDTVPGVDSIAAGNPGNPVMIDNIMLGDANLGRMVIPSAQIYSSITLEPQSAAAP
ncbi:DUF6160 family protein [Alcanivorax sp.]|uniref:DUF6160 family protein n=1 Tax=Alcanivorax sp. TaxID=1872427 RepID=UPI0032D8FA0E